MMRQIDGRTGVQPLLLEKLTKTCSPCFFHHPPPLTSDSANVSQCRTHKKPPVGPPPPTFFFFNLSSVFTVAAESHEEQAEIIMTIAAEPRVWTPGCVARCLPGSAEKQQKPLHGADIRQWSLAEQQGHLFNLAVFRQIFSQQLNVLQWSSDRI